MTDEEFQQKLEEVKRILGELSFCPQWNQKCNVALEAGEMTLEDALQAVEFAAAPQGEVDEFLDFLRQITEIPKLTGGY